MQWETFTVKPPTHKSGMHTIDNSIAAEAKITVLIRKIEALEMKDSSKNQVQQISNPTCNHCQASNHVFEDCPLISNLFNNNQEQLNVVFQRQNNPYGQTYNPGWKNHPNFSWSQNNYQGNQQFATRPAQGQFPNQFQNQFPQHYANAAP